MSLFTILPSPHRSPQIRRINFLTNPEPLANSCHMFYSRRVVDIPDGKPKWTEMNDASELITEGTHETNKRKRGEAERE